MTDSPSIPVPSIILGLSDQTRWNILAALAKENALPTSEIALRVGRTGSTISKHVSLLHNLGILHRGYGKVYSIPSQFRVEGQPLTLDFGSALIRLDHLGKR